MTAVDIISSGLLELYVMGIASPEETRDVENWAKQYPEVAAEIEAIQSVMQNYAQENAIEPAPAVKENIFAAIQNTSATQAPVKEMSAPAKVYNISPSWKYAAAASIVLLIGSVIFNYTYYNKYKSANAELATTKTELQQQMEIVQATSADMEHIKNKYAMPVNLPGMTASMDTVARIYWMQDSHEVYVDRTNLPAPPSGMQYQFWAIVDGVPVSGGMINLPDGRSVRLQKMKSFGKAQAFAVSLEKAGPEKPAPSQVVVMGKI